MDVLKTAVSFITFQRFYRYILKRVLGGILEPDFGMDQVEVQLFRGELRLADVRLNIGRINRSLKAQQVSFQLVSGTISRMRIRIPWRRVLNEPCKVYLHHLHLRVSLDSNSSGHQDSSCGSFKEAEKSPPSTSTLALVELVRQVLIKIEACIDRVTVELDDGSDLVFETKDIVVYSEAGGAKRISIGDSEVRMESRRESILRLTPMSATVDFSDASNVSILVKMHAATVALGRRRTIRDLLDLLSRLRRINGFQDSESIMYKSVIEGESFTQDTSARPWYEEVYQVIESEVIRSSQVKKDEFVEPNEEVIEVEELALMRIGHIKLEVERIRLSLLGVEEGIPGVSAILKNSWIDFANSLSSFSSAVEDISVFLDPVLTNPAMFLSSMSADHNDASSVYESVVDSEDSVGMSETFDLSDHSEDDTNLERLNSASSENRDWEAVFFDSDTETLGSAMKNRNTEESFVSFTKPSGTVILDHLKVFLSKSDAIDLKIESPLSIILTPDLMANFGVFSSTLGDCMHQIPTSELDNKTSVPFSATFPGLLVRFELGNGHELVVKSDCEIAFRSGQGSIDRLEISAGESQAAVLSNLKLGFYLPAVPEKTIPRYEESPGKEEGIWTAVGGPARGKPLRADTQSNPPKKAGNVWDLEVGKRLKIDISEIQICDSPVTFLDLQLKLMSLIDQLGMAGLALGAKPPPCVSPPYSAVDILVDTAKVHAVELKTSNVRIIQSGSGPLLGLKVDKIAVGQNLVKSERSALEVSMEVCSGLPLSQIFVLVTARNLRAEFSEQVVEEYEQILRFFVPPVDIAPLHAAPLITAPPRPTVTMVTLRIEDSFVCVPHAAVILVDGLEASSGILSTVDKETPVGVSFKAEKLALAIAKERTSDWNFLPDIDLVTNLKQRGYVEVVSLTNGEGLLEWKEGSQSRLKLDLNIGQIRADLKADTYDGLCDFSSKIKVDLQRMIQTISSSSEEEIVTLPLPPCSQPIPAKSTKFVIREDFVQSRTSGRGGSRFSRPTAPPTMTDIGARWLVDPSTVQVLHDHLTNEEQKEKRRIAESRKEMQTHATEICGGFESISVTVKNIAFLIVEGSDWEGSEYLLAGLVAPRRLGQSFVCAELESVGLDIARSKKDDWVNLNVSAADFRIRDGVVGSVYQHVLCQWGTRIGSDALSAWFAKRDQGESKGEISVAPICVTVDQDTLEFMNAFISRVSRYAVRRGAEGVELDINLDDFEDDQESLGDENSVELRPIGERLFKNFQVSNIDVELSYRAKRLSLRKLGKGDTLQLLNLVPLLEGLRVSLGQVRMVDVASVEDIANRILAAWTRDMNKAHIIKSLASVKPLKSFSNLSASLADLVRQPLRQMKRKDGRVSRGVLRGVSSFVRTLTIESLNLADVVVSSAQSALEMVDSATRPVEQLDCVLEDEEEENSWIPVERGARERALDPASAIEGLRTGSDSLLRGVNVTLARGAPGFILQPAIGAAEAVSVVIRGARSVVDSGRHHAETERKYKGPHVHSDLLTGI